MVQGTCSSAGLPPPWQEVHAEGLTYFWNTETNATTYDRPVAGMAPSKPANDYSYLGGASAVQNTGADDSFGALDYNAPPPDAYQRAGGLEINTDVKYGSTQSGEDYRRKMEITVKAPRGIQTPDPQQTFAEGGWPQQLLDAVTRAGYTSPTPIQAQSWPIALQGYDLISVAKTGSGKTVGYLFPGIMHIRARANGPRPVGPTVAVLAPTRELATQIQEETAKFGRAIGMFSVCLYGGAPKGMQLRELRSGPQIAIATPGRLNDFLESGAVNLGSATYVVLDEADRMLDMGFEPQIRKILARAPPARQTLFFTATWPKAVVRVATAILTNPIQVNIGDTDSLVANKDISQVIEVCGGFQKQQRLMEVLRNPPAQPLKAIVFCSTKRMCDQIGRSMGGMGAVIHGDKEQRERDYIINQFKSGRVPVLVATDVAARGLDIKEVNLVVNFDFPNQIEDYVHRIGRTGRAGNKGHAHSFIEPGEGNMARKLIPILRDAGQTVSPEIQEMATRGGGGGGGGGDGDGRRRRRRRSDGPDRVPPGRALARDEPRRWGGGRRRRGGGRRRGVRRRRRGHGGLSEAG
uniref:RNA helicase n=1 Tax=Micromonas pusilla TaxID=38833 RepID=A0A7R9XYM2_MICPS|mmetsp:Transcript_1893/g.6207  ORF Transcript_1893/g.6207 Transcript_1893/m.6207 type:complete len:578 (+) Transcript_1893:248-1981(+)